MVQSEYQGISGETTSPPDAGGENSESAHGVLSEEAKIRALRDRRKAGEISPHDFDVNEICRIAAHGGSLRYSDVLHVSGSQAIVMTYDDMRQVGSWSFIDRAGERVEVSLQEFPEDSILIITPEMLGDTEGQPRLEIAQLVEETQRDIDALKLQDGGV